MGGEVGNKTMPVCSGEIGESYEFGLYPEKHERLLKGFKWMNYKLFAF